MSQNSPSRRSSISSINSRNSFFNSPGSPLRLNNLATTPSPIRRLRNLNPSPPNQRRRRRRTRRNSPNLNIRSPSPAPSYNFNLNNATVNDPNLNNVLNGLLRNLNNTPSTQTPNQRRNRRRPGSRYVLNNSPVTTPISPASPLQDLNEGPIFTTAGQRPILTTFSNEENGLINTPPSSPPRLARRLNFSSPVRIPYNRTRKSRQSTSHESLLSRENLRELQRRRRELVSNAKRAPHNLASNFDPTTSVAAAEPVDYPIHMQQAVPAATLNNLYAPLAIATSKNVSNTVIPAKEINEIRKKRKQRKTKKLEQNLKKIFNRKRFGGTKKRNNKNKRNTKKNRRNNRKK